LSIFVLTAILIESRPEVFTTELRAKANAVVQVIHYSISLVITQCSPNALAAVGWKYYVSLPGNRSVSLGNNEGKPNIVFKILFILTNFLCTIVFAFAYPETKGKSLEEIADIFGDVQVIHEADVQGEKAAVETLERRSTKASN
jgi:hypothetical protein